ncbi:MAG: hypothetical protein JSV68_05445 [Anaerolineaceae bacterium]|nr:MAG: hypothetical protein JSV68_05445 [Anaerolineaceae bacterium]
MSKEGPLDRFFRRFIFHWKFGRFSLVEVPRILSTFMSFWIPLATPIVRGIYVLFLTVNGVSRSATKSYIDGCLIAYTHQAQETIAERGWRLPGLLSPALI